MENLIEAVKDAELVLIGIGEEFQTKEIKFATEEFLFDDRLNGLAQYDFYMEVLRKRFLQQHRDSQIAEAYDKLAALCDEKNYYIVSTCYDDVIYDSRLNEEKIVTPCGGRRMIQCDGEAERKIFDVEQTSQLEAQILKAFDKKDFASLLEVEENCKGKKLSYNCILNEDYNEEGYLDKWQIYLKWLQGTINKKVCIIELGVGMMFPSVIRWPFEKVAFYNQKATFYRVHEQLYQMTAELSEKGKPIHMNSVEFLGKLFV